MTDNPRFIVVGDDTLKQDYPEQYEVWAHAWGAYDLYLIDTKTGKVVYTDAGNVDYPEDMTLDGDLSTFVDLLNEVTA